MYLNEIQLNNFRNYDRLKLDFSPRINIIYGKNAQGKTNLLEAVSLLCLGKSFRTKKEAELIKYNKEVCFLKGTFLNDDLEDVIEIGIGDKQKKVKINSQSVRATSLFGRNSLVSFAPDDLQIIKGSPQLRRDFLDFYLAQIEPAYRKIYLEFYKVLQQRNKFLKSIIPDKSELEVWNEQLVRTGTKVIQYRALLINRIKEYISDAHAKISVEKEKLNLVYSSLGISEIHLKNAIEIQQIFLENLNKQKFNEIERHQTLVGPQRDDLSILLNENIDLKTYGSQGQQRTAALALKLGMVDILTDKNGQPPILLLDDVMSEFDDSRKQALLMLLSGTSQTFLTSTEKRDFPIPASGSNAFYKIEEGMANHAE